jgi:hypothetical protein
MRRIALDSWELPGLASKVCIVYRLHVVTNRVYRHRPPLSDGSSSVPPFSTNVFDQTLAEKLTVARQAESRILQPDQSQTNLFVDLYTTTVCKSQTRELEDDQQLL